MEENRAMTGTHRRTLPVGRLIPFSLAFAVSVLIRGTEVQAQVQRQPTAATSAQVAPGAIQAPIDPLKAEVQQLRAEVNRLHAALESLRLTVNANSAAFLKHRHSVASYGVLTAKAIYPNTQVDDKTLVVIKISGQNPTALTGPAE
jgi:uncharacterized protein YlxW (UPF0749 family)